MLPTPPTKKGEPCDPGLAPMADYEADGRTRATGSLAHGLFFRNVNPVATSPSSSETL